MSYLRWRSWRAQHRESCKALPLWGVNLASSPGLDRNSAAIEERVPLTVVGSSARSLRQRAVEKRPETSSDPVD